MLAESYDFINNRIEEEFYSISTDVQTPLQLKLLKQTLKSKQQKELENLCKLFIQNSDALRKTANEWVFAHSLAAFNELKLAKNESGLYSSNYLKKQILSDVTLKGLWILFSYANRSDLLAKQTAPTCVNYCALVPLILSAFKLFREIQYEEWDRFEISSIMEPSLYKAINITVERYSDEEILEARNAGLLVRSSGKLRSPESTYVLYIPGSSPLATLPTLTKIMLCQTWCAHPVNRTKYMILSPYNLDEMPKPLITDDIIDKNYGKKD